MVCYGDSFTCTSKGQLHTLVASPPPHTHLMKRLWTREPVSDCYGDERNLLLLQGIEPGSLCGKTLVQNVIEIHLVVSEIKNTDGIKHLFPSLFC
jgi:hypothetical protein